MKKIKSIVRAYFQKKNIIIASKQKRTAQFQTFDDIRTVVLLGKSDQLEELNLIMQDLKNNGKTVFMFLILSSRQVEKTTGLKEKFAPECYLIDPATFSWRGAFTDLDKNKFLQIDCDAVFDFGADDVRFHQLLLSHPCRFRIGIVSCGYLLYDFCVLKQDSQTLTDVYQQIKKYLSSIRSSTINS